MSPRIVCEGVLLIQGILYLGHLRTGIIGKLEGHRGQACDIDDSPFCLDVICDRLRVAAITCVNTSNNIRSLCSLLKVDFR